MNCQEVIVDGRSLQELETGADRLTIQVRLGEEMLERGTLHPISARVESHSRWFFDTSRGVSWLVSIVEMPQTHTPR